MSDDLVAWLASVADEPFAYLTTVGRVTGDPHVIEIWFAARDATVHFLAGGRDDADRVRNLRREPRVTIRITGRTAVGTARVIAADHREDAMARDLVWRRYARAEGHLTSWRDTAPTVAVDIGATCRNA